MNVEYLTAQLAFKELQNQALCAIIASTGASELEMCVETMESELHKVG